MRNVRTKSIVESKAKAKRRRGSRWIRCASKAASVGKAKASRKLSEKDESLSQCSPTEREASQVPGLRRGQRQEPPRSSR